MALFRWFIQLMLVGFGFALLHTNEVYEKDKEYIYRFTSEALMGAPGISDHYSGGSFHCDTIVQFWQPTVVVVQSVNMTTTEHNMLMRDFEPRIHRVPDSARIKNHMQVPKVREIFALPMKIRYDKGHVLDLYTVPHEPDWSVEMKKYGMDGFEIAIEKVLKSKNFSVFELSSEGFCETHYTVRQEPGSKEMFIRKVIDLPSCIDRDVYTKNSFEGIKCIDCTNHTFQPLKEDYVVTMRVIVDGEKFLLKEVIGEHNYTLAPSQAQPNVSFIMTRHASHIVDIRPIKHRIPVPHHVKKAENPLKVFSVKYEKLKRQLTNPRPRISEREHLMEQHQENPFHQLLLLQIQKLIHKITEAMKSPLSPDTPYEMNLLVEMLRSCSLGQLTSVVKSHMAVPQSRDIVLDILPAVGTGESVSVLANLIRRNMIHPNRAAFLVNILALHADPDPRIITTLTSLIRTRIVNTHVQLRRAVLLTTGAICHRYRETVSRFRQRTLVSIKKLHDRIKHQDDRVLKYELFQLFKKYHFTLKKLEATESHIISHVIQIVHPLLLKRDPQSKILGLKFMGNAGIPDLRRHVVLIAHDRSLPVVVRTQAVYSLRRLATVIPEKVIKVLLPILKDKSEPYDVRIAAYKVLVDCRPPTEVWRTFGKLLETETDPQLGSFIYSHLIQFANSSHPCIYDVIKNATEALKVSQPKKYGIYQSNVLHFSFFDDSQNVGQAIDIMSIASHNSWLVKSFMIKTNIFLLGQSINPLEIGMNTDGLERFLNYIRHPTRERPGLHPTRSTHWDSAHSQVDGRQTIKNIKDTLRVDTRRHPPESLGHVYVKLFGNEMRFIDLDINTITDLINPGQSSSGASFIKRLETGIPVNIEKCLVLGRTFIEIPSQAGAPLDAQVDATAVVKLDGSIKAIVRKNPSNRLLPSRIEVDIDLRPRLILDLQSHFGMDVIFAKMGVASNKQLVIDHLHIKTHAIIDLERGKMFKTIELFKQEAEIVRYHDRPMTYHRKEPSIAPMIPTEYKEINLNQQPLEMVNETIDTKEFGVVLSASGERSPMFGQFNPIIIPFNPFASFRKLSIMVKPSGQKVDKLEIHMAYNSTTEDIQKLEKPEIKPVKNLRSNSAKSSSWFPWWSGDSMAAQVGANQSPAVSEKFVDLKQRDLVFAEVVSRIKTDILPNSEKRAFLAMARTVGSPRPAQFQIEALWQELLNGRRHRVDVCVTRAINASKHWQMNIQSDIAMDLETALQESGSVNTSKRMWQGAATATSITKQIPDLVQRIDDDIKKCLNNSTVNIDCVSGIRRDLPKLLSLTQEISKFDTKEHQSCIKIISSILPRLDGLVVVLRKHCEESPTDQVRLNAYVEILVESMKLRKIIAELSRPIVLLRSDVGMSSSEAFSISVPEMKMVKFACRSIDVITNMIRNESSRLELGFGLLLKALKKDLDKLALVYKHASSAPHRITEPLRTELKNAVGSLKGVVTICQNWTSKSKKVHELCSIIKMRTHKIESLISVKPQPKFSSAYFLTPSNPAMVSGAQIKNIITQIEHYLDRMVEVAEFTTKNPNRQSESELFHVMETALDHLDMLAVKVDSAQPLTVQEVREKITRIISTIETMAVPRLKEASVALGSVIPGSVVISEAFIRRLIERVTDIRNIIGIHWTLSMGEVKVETIKPAPTQPKWRMPVSVSTKITFGESSAIQLTIFKLGSADDKRMLEAAISQWRNDTSMAKVVRNKLPDVQKLLSLRSKLDDEKGEMKTALVHLHYHIVEDKKLLKPLIRYILFVFNATYPLFTPTPVARQPLSCGVMEAVIGVKPDGKLTEVIVSSPSGEVKYVTVPRVYRPCHPLAGSPIHSIFIHNSLKLYSSKFTPATCIVDGLNVQTFDEKNFTLPANKMCERFLAMDCSHSNKFAIIMKYLPEATMLRVIIPHHIIMIQSRPHDEPHVMINGHALVLSPGHDTAIPIPGQQPCTIKRMGHTIVFISSFVGVKVTIIGRKIEIQTSPKYRAQICGLCGNNDGNAENDLTDPKLIRHSKVEDFAATYVFPSSECNSTSPHSSNTTRGANRLRSGLLNVVSTASTPTGHNDSEGSGKHPQQVISALVQSTVPHERFNVDEWSRSEMERERKRARKLEVIDISTFGHPITKTPSRNSMVCEINANHVRLFSGSPMSLPQNTDCMRLLATDPTKCAVIMRPSTNATKVLMVIPGCLIIISSNDARNSVLINGNKVVINPNAQISRPKQCPVVMRERNGKIMVGLLSVRVKVEIRNKHVMIQTPKSMQIEGVCNGHIKESADVASLLSKPLHDAYKAHMTTAEKTCPDVEKKPKSWLTRWLF